MQLVVALALMTTLGIWILPWALQRSADSFRWWDTLRGQMTSFWWAAVSIISFGGVMVAGRAFGLVGAAASGLLLDGVFAWTFHRRFGTARRLQRLCAAVAPGAPETTLRALEAELARFREASEPRVNGYTAWVQWTLHAAARVSLAGHTAEALRWTERIDPSRVGVKLRGVYVQHGAAFRVALGDRPGARALIATTPRPAEPASMELAIQAIECLLEAIEGDAAAALARADVALAGPHEASLKLTWLATRAHALVASGAQREARALLHAIQAEHGDLPLKRIGNHRGPASAAAETLLTTQAPYR